jgi:hypothetical protein
MDWMASTLRPELRNKASGLSRNRHICQKPQMQSIAVTSGGSSVDANRRQETREVARVTRQQRRNTATALGFPLASIPFMLARVPIGKGRAPNREAK